MSYSDGICWLLGQPAAISGKYNYGNFAQRLLEYVKKYTPDDFRSDYIHTHHSLSSTWIPAS